MFRNQYDNDITTWSPQGRIHQIEYAMEAVNQGSCAIGLKSRTHAVLIALKRSAHELSHHQKKLVKIDDHVGVAIAGITSDARVLCKFMRTECLNSKYVFDTPLPTSRLITAVSDKAQVTTQQYGCRPYGVGILVAGYDRESGPCIFQFCPSSNFFDCHAMAVGARSQSARTYLQRQLAGFPDDDRATLIRHGLRALRESLPNNTELTTENASVGVVSANEPFTIIDGDDLAPYLDNLDEGAPDWSRRRDGAKAAVTGLAEPADEPLADPMDQDNA